MKLLLLLTLLVLGTAAPAVHAEDDKQDEKKDGLLPKVEKPIPDTYEPLEGADWNHRLSPELETLREYQRQQEEKAESEERKKLRDKLEGRIQEPGAEQVIAPEEPEIEETNDSMRIGDPE